jgi:hypothetical protein
MRTSDLMESYLFFNGIFILRCYMVSHPYLIQISAISNDIFSQTSLEDEAYPSHCRASMISRLILAKLDINIPRVKKPCDSIQIQF